MMTSACPTALSHLFLYYSTFILSYQHNYPYSGQISSSLHYIWQKGDCLIRQPLRPSIQRQAVTSYSTACCVGFSVVVGFTVCFGVGVGFGGHLRNNRILRAFELNDVIPVRTS